MAKFLANGLQVVLDCLEFPEQTCSVKDGTIQVKLYLVRMIIENVDVETSLVNLDQSKALYSVDHRFLETVLLAAGCKP